MTSIEWVKNADGSPGKTWNPIVGCSVATPGCTNCYAMKMAHRLANNPATPHYAGTVKVVNGKPVWTGKIALAPDHVLTAPMRRKKPTNYFVNSMGDLFHEGVPDEWIDQVFAVMAVCPQHTFQVLTKRAGRMREYFTSAPKRQSDWDCYSGFEYIDLPLPKVWLGVSVEDQTRADERIPHLLNTPAAVRFVSCEPLLGPVDLTDIRYLHVGRRFSRSALHTLDTPPLDWVIVGGESGPDARPMHPKWARSLRDQCAASGIPFFMKQWGEWVPLADEHWDHCVGFDRSIVFEGQKMVRVGKKAAGRALDGVVHDGRPG